VLHPIQIPLERQPVRISRFSHEPVPSTDTPGSPRSKREIQGVLPLHTGGEPPAHEGGDRRMRANDRRAPATQSINRETRRCGGAVRRTNFSHRTTIRPGCDNNEPAGTCQWL